MASERRKNLSRPKIMYLNLCRICLKSGEIPIFGSKEKPDLSSDIAVFGAIQVYQNDDMPQHLCNSCYILLQNAILFRYMAKKSVIAIKYQKSLLEEKNMSVDDKKINNSECRIKEHVSDHNYTRNIPLNSEEQSCSKDRIGFEGAHTQIIENNDKKSKEIKQETDIGLSKIKKGIEMEKTAFSCKICNVNFVTPSEFHEHNLTTTHIKKVKILERIECDICKAKMNRSYNLAHILNHSFGPTPAGGTRHICRICNTLLNCGADTRLQRIPKGRRTAIQTSTEIELKPHLSHHVSEVANRKKYKCPLCSKVMAYSYTTHLKRKHKIDVAALMKSKISVNGKKKSIEDKTLKEDSKNEIKDAIENSFYYDLNDSSKVSEPPSSDEVNSLENVDILIEQTIDTTSNNIIINVDTDTKNAENDVVEDIDINKIDKPVHTCEMCNLNFQTSDDYYEHLGTLEHSDAEQKCPKMECNICKKIIKKYNYIRHLKYHCFKPIPSGGVYNCKICNEILHSEFEAKTHINSELHKISEKAVCEIECPLCHMKVEIKFLTNHLQQHFSETFCKIKCSICSKIVNFRYYPTHLKEKHNADKIREVVMDYDTVFKDNTTFSTETKEKSFVCDICGKIFKKSAIFKSHCLIHTGEKNYKCEFCPYQCITKGLLKTHLKTHLGIYNYRCDLCPKRKFLSKSNLDKHVRTHRGPIDFKCEICHKGFYTKPDLKRHFDYYHLGMKNEVCHICNKTFCRKKNLLSHIKTVHKHISMK